MRIDHLRQIPLESVLARVGATRDGQDKQKWHTERGTVVIEKNGLRYNSFDGSGLHGRGMIDLVMQLHGLQFLEAVRWIDAKYAGAALEKEHRDLSSNRPANRPTFRLLRQYIGLELSNTSLKSESLTLGPATSCTNKVQSMPIDVGMPCSDTAQMDVKSGEPRSDGSLALEVGRQGLQLPVSLVPKLGSLSPRSTRSALNSFGRKPT